jgi:hypothetical protein
MCDKKTTMATFAVGVGGAKYDGWRPCTLSEVQSCWSILLQTHRRYRGLPLLAPAPLSVKESTCLVCASGQLRVGGLVLTAGAGAQCHDTQVVAPTYVVTPLSQYEYAPVRD